MNNIFSGMIRAINFVYPDKNGKPSVNFPASYFEKINSEIENINGDFCEWYWGLDDFETAEQYDECIAAYFYWRKFKK